MVINVHAGHNPDGKVACGAIGLIKESTEARNVKNEVIRQLQLLGNHVFDCTVDDGKSQADVLTKIVNKCNSTAANLDVSIHFNSGANDKGGNGRSTGVEVYVYSKDAGAQDYAKRVVDAIANLGFKNRGVKENKDLFVLRKTKAPAMLIECCFVDDADDVQLYDVQSMASAIVYGITGKVYKEPAVVVDNEASKAGSESKTGDANTIYRVQVGAFKNKDNAEKLKAQLINAGFQAFITK